MFCGSGKAAGTDRFTAEFPMPHVGVSVSVQVVQKSDTKREPDARDVPDARPVEQEGRRERQGGAPDPNVRGRPQREGGREGGPRGSSVEVPARDGSP